MSLSSDVIMQQHNWDTAVCLYHLARGLIICAVITDEGRIDAVSHFQELWQAEGKAEHS